MFSLQTALAAPTPPTVQTDPAGDNFLDEAILHGQITATGGEDCDERGFDWRPHSDSAWQSWTETSGGPFGTGSYTHDLTGLDAGRVYAFRAKAHNSAGWSYGAVRTFRVIAIGTMVTLPATDITPGSATLNAKLVDDGGYNLGNRAFRYRKVGSETWFNPFESGSFGPLVAFDDGFEDGTLDPFLSKSISQWTVDGEQFYLGGHSARSGFVANNDMSHLVVQATVANDESTLRFAYRVSSETDSDFLVFYIDEEDGGRWSGETGWQEFSLAIPAGEHRLEWIYQKDGHGGQGLDAAWIDEVRITSPAYFSMGAPNLEPGTTYECYSYGYNPAGMSNGGTLQFTTTTAVPTMSTGDASLITSIGATLNGNILAVNTLTPCEERGFDWRRQGDTGWTSWTESGGYTTGGYSKAISGLIPATTYEVQAKSRNSVGWGYGAVKTFTTANGPPAVQADPATSIDQDSAILNGTILHTGGVICDWRGFQYMPLSGQNWLPLDIEYGSFGTGPFSYNLSGLDPGTSYKFRCFAHNAYGYTMSNELNFTTKAVPTVQSAPAIMITADHAILNGDITDTGGLDIDERGFEWHQQGDPGGWQSWTEAPGPYGTGIFYRYIDGLLPYTTYEFKAKARNAAGWAYGGTLTFRTLALAPTVTTDPATDIGEGYGMLHGNITGIGGQQCDIYTFEWRGPGESWNSWSQGQEGVPQFGTGSFSYHCGPYDPGTTIEFRFKAHNSAGWTNGDTLSFTTLHPAVMRTDPATDVTINSAVLHGEILDTGGIDCDQRGFYVRKVGAPEWNGAVDPGAFPAGPYSKTVSGLDPGCDYEFKAYAYTPYTSAQGFGDVLTFRTAMPSAVQTETATDVATTSADIHGLITDAGGENCDQHGFEWRKQGDVDWLGWSETGDYPADIRLSDGFEDGTVPPFWTGGAGYSPWAVIAGGAGGSAYCAKSPVISDTQSAYIRGGAQAKKVSFRFKVSSEQDYDSLVFKVDEQEVARWSGEHDWESATFELAPGQHVFDWWYQKDDNLSQGSDCAWIDDVRAETPFDLHLTGLDPGSTYEFRARSHNSTGWSTGETRVLTTESGPEVHTGQATNVGRDSATLNGEITSQGAEACDLRGFEYRAAGQETWSSWVDTSPSPFGPGNYSGTVSGLQAGTRYSFRAKANNAGGLSYGEIHTFETTDVPTMETDGATSVDHESAALNGVIASTGGVACDERGFQWRKQGDAAWQSWTETGSYSTDRLSEVSHDFEDGTLGTLSSYSGDPAFNMVWRPEKTDLGAGTGAWCARSPVMPDTKLTEGYIWQSYMQNLYNVDIPGDDYRIRFARKVSSEQDHDFLEFYIYTDDGTLHPFPGPSGVWSGEVPWDTVSYPIPAGNNAFYWRYWKDVGHAGLDAALVDDIVIESTIPFSHRIEGLDMGTTYEFRSLGKNPVSAQNAIPDDYSYGPSQYFTTAQYSVTRTNDASSKTSVSAVLNGEVTNTGGLDVDERGFEWRRQGAGQWASWTESAGPYGTGEFSHGITGLLGNVTYEFKAKAHTAAGWSEGALKTFTTPAVPPSPSSTWYLAEGTTAWGFEAYLSIMNPNPSALTAHVTYMLKGGATETLDVPLPAGSQTTVNPRETVGEQDFSTKVVSSDLTKAIAVDRTMTWTGGAGANGSGAGQESHSSVGVTAPSEAWFMPEGSTKWGFETWLCIQNPNAGKATCEVTYMIEGADPVTKVKEVPGNSRETFNMFNDIGERDASIKVTADKPVIPERSMYRNNRREGHESIGTTAAAADFYLAEGTTAYGFTSYVCVQNPNDSAVEVDITYMTPAGPVSHPGNPVPMAANSRKTIRVNDVLPNQDFSTRVSCSKPIIAERAMYWDSGTGEACHDSIGMASAHMTFYLPDGQCSDGCETYICVQNPNSGDVTVELTYMTPDGAGNVKKTETVGGGSRQTFSMGGHSGMSSRAAIMVVSKTAGRPIMVERAMYWNDRGAGTDTIGGCSD